MKDFLDEIMHYEVADERRAVVPTRHPRSCGCPKCLGRKSRQASFREESTWFDEWMDEAFGFGIPPIAASNAGETRPCPVNAPGKASEKCKNPSTRPCPPVPGLLCNKAAGGIPFEHFKERYFDPKTRLHRIKKTIPGRELQFIPPTRNALIEFLKNMARFGMPVKSLITEGSYYCRCVSGTDSLSNHAHGEAFDLVGVRWKNPHPFSRVEDTILTDTNLKDPEQYRLYQRINACLRLSFDQVIDYHRADHRDHFHCDMNRGRGFRVCCNVICFVQESLALVLRQPVQRTGKLDTQTYHALSAFSPNDAAAMKDPTLKIPTLTKVYRKLFEVIAAGNFAGGKFQAAECRCFPRSLC